MSKEGGWSVKWPFHTTAAEQKAACWRACMERD